MLQEVSWRSMDVSYHVSTGKGGAAWEKWYVSVFWNKYKPCWSREELSLVKGLGFINCYYRILHVVTNDSLVESFYYFNNPCKEWHWLFFTSIKPGQSNIVKYSMREKERIIIILNLISIIHERICRCPENITVESIFTYIYATTK